MAAHSGSTAGLTDVHSACQKLLNLHSRRAGRHPCLTVAEMLTTWGVFCFFFLISAFQFKQLNSISQICLLLK